MGKEELSRYRFAEQGEVCSPQLIFYPELIRENIRRMKALAKGPDRLWPHIKTHKSADVAKMLVEEGIVRMKCATIAELEMAASSGAKHLVLAYPLIGPNVGRFLRLRAAFPEVTFYAVEDDTAQAARLGEAALAAGGEVNLLMDVDMGQHRTGVPFERVEELYRAWDRLPGIRMRGMHCYDGHRHESDSAVRMSEVRKEDVSLAEIRDRLAADGLDVSVIILGGTPSFPCHEELMDHYLSPGTCVIQDAGYRDAYPDLDFIPAAAVLVRVVSRPGRDTFTMDLGTKAVACDPSPERAVIVGMEYARTVMHNEEHWVVRVPEEHIEDIPEIGSVLFALPVHICPTTALYPEAAAVAGGHLQGWWPITARNRRITF